MPRLGILGTLVLVASVLVVASPAWAASTTTETSEGPEPVPVGHSVVTPAGVLTEYDPHQLANVPGMHVISYPVLSSSGGSGRGGVDPNLVTQGGGSGYFVYADEYLDLYYNDEFSFVCAYLVASAWVDPAWGDVDELGELWVNGSLVATTTTSSMGYTGEETGCYGGTPELSLWSASVSAAGYWPTAQGPVYAWAQANGSEIQ